MCIAYISCDWIRMLSMWIRGQQMEWWHSEEFINLMHFIWKLARARMKLHAIAVVVQATEWHSLKVIYRNWYECTLEYQHLFYFEDGVVPLKRNSSSLVVFARFVSNDFFFFFYWWDDTSFFSDSKHVILIGCHGFFLCSGRKREEGEMCVL